MDGIERQQFGATLLSTDHESLNDTYPAVGGAVSSPSQAFEADDWVIARGRLGSVIRIGYGLFSGQARISWSNEDVAAWSSGEWLPISEIRQLERPIQFRCMQQILSADEPAVRFSSGTTGSLLSFDRDGDLVVSIDGQNGRKCIFQSDAVSLDFG